MNPLKLQVKIFVDGGADLPLESLVPVFHAWIKQRRLNELLVDVANYLHVPKGPGVGVVGHESDYFMDESEGRLGLLYSRKRETISTEDRIRDSFRRAFHAAALLEQEKALGGKLRFRTDELLLRVNDRISFPSTPEVLDGLRPQLDPFLSELFGPGASEMKLVSTPRQLFTVRVAVNGRRSLADVLQHLGATIA